MTQGTPSWPADRVERRPLVELVPNARNVRTHSQQQLDKLKDSLRKHGWTTAVLVDESGAIIAGHGRVLAAQQLVDEGDERFTEAPVMVAAGWTEAQKRAYTIADNRLAELSDWDLKALGDELKTFDASTLQLVGFTEDDLAALATEGSITFDEPPDSVKRNVEDMERVKAQRRKGNEGIIGKTDTENYLVIVYRSRKQREEVLRQLGLPSDERYVPGDSVEVRKRFGKVVSKIEADRETKAAPPNKAGAQG